MSQTRIVTFNTFFSLYSNFKKACELRGVTMSRQMEHLTQEYLNGNLASLDTLSSYVSKAKESSANETKCYKMNLHFDADLYQSLKESLLSCSRTRPSSFFTFVMAFFVSQISADALHRADAYSFFKAADPSICHIVYALKYYAPDGTNRAPKLVHTEYFYELCTEDRFQFYQEIDRECPLITVLSAPRP